MQQIMAFKRAMRRQRFDEADALLKQIPTPAPQDLNETIGLLHLLKARWAQATETLQKLDQLNDDMAALARFAANMASLQEHRPQLFALISDLPDSDRYEIVTAPATTPAPGSIATSANAENSSDAPEQFTIGDRQTGRFVIASNSGAALNQAVCESINRADTDPLIPVSVMALGIGDGHALTMIYNRPRKSNMAPAAALHVIEPDPQLFKSCLYLHDWSGDDGLLADPRVIICLGDQWHQAWQKAMTQDLRCPLPQQMLRLGQGTHNAHEKIQAAVDQINANTQSLHQKLDRYYQSFSDRSCAKALTGEANRAPKVMWLASRFTTVVQYSAQDALDGLASQGFETQLLQEHHQHHQFTTRYLMHAINQFKPDAFMVINYNRKQFGDRLPQHLPMGTWLQDESAELLTPEAGASIDTRQFVATCCPSMYHQIYKYPKKQLFYLDKLTRVPPEPTTPIAKQPWVVFVSNAARTHGQLVDDLAKRCNGPVEIKLIKSCCEKLFATYEKGQHFDVAKQLFPLIQQSAQDIGLKPLGQDELVKLAMLLFNSINNTLYRQQAIRWAIQAAETNHLELRLYGQNWDQNPEFKTYNHGYANYGDELTHLTRQATFNLQIVPFTCMHQRLLDGWAAGGLFLIRDHPADRLNETWNDLFDHLPQTINDLPSWKKVMPADFVQKLDAALAERQQLNMDATEEVDLVTQARQMLAEGYQWGASLPPRLADVRFNNAQSLTELMRTYLNQPQAAQEVLQDQRRFLVDKGLTYAAGMQNFINKMAKELSA